MTYAGLTISDKSAMLEAQKNGHTYIYLNHDGFKTVYNVNLALAQIAEMEKAQKPMTVGDKVVELWATDKRAFAARFVITRNTYGFKTYYALHGQLNRTKHGEIEHDNVEDAIQDELDFLNSPYTEGANQ